MFSRQPGLRDTADFLAASGGWIEMEIMGYCSSLISITVINAPTKINLRVGRKDFISVYRLQPVIKRSREQSGSLKVGLLTIPQYCLQ